MKTLLKISFCSFTAIEFACLNWHYSKTVPAGKLIKLGVWEDDKFIGVVIFGRGANNRIGTPFNLKQTEVCELVRVALTNHKSPVSKIISIALKILHKTNPGIKLVVSYADTAQSHHGGIYQATNWAYLGESLAARAINPLTKKLEHTRSLASKFGTVKGFKFVKDSPKHKYVYAFDKSIKLETKPYPKNMRTRCDSHTAEFHSADEGANPISPLQSELN